jgi:hypothetical protein
MSATMAGLGDHGPSVNPAADGDPETRLGKGPINLAGMALIGTAQVFCNLFAGS